MTATLVQPGRKAGLHDIGRRLDNLPVGRVHRKIVVAIGLGLFFEVYEIFLSSTIATALKTEYGFGGTALEILMASSFIGMFVGAAAFGRIADRIGRRNAFLVNLVWFSVWSIIGAIAPNPWMLVGARFMAGIGVGAEYPVADSYLSDVLPKADRGRLAAWTYTCSFLAVPVLGFLSLSMNGRSIFGFDGWRVLLVLGAVGALFVIYLRRGLPESPRWLASVGRTDEAEAAVRAFEAGSAPAPADYHRYRRRGRGRHRREADDGFGCACAAAAFAVPAASDRDGRVPSAPALRLLRVRHAGGFGPGQPRL